MRLSLGDRRGQRVFPGDRLLVEGKRNKEIAEALSLSMGTVRVYVSNILSKLEVSNRTEAAKLLGWGRNTLTRKISELHLTDL